MPNSNGLETDEPVDSVPLEASVLDFFAKRPPERLSLLMACRWRDSWRYGCELTKRANLTQVDCEY